MHNVLLLLYLICIINFCR